MEHDQESEVVALTQVLTQRGRLSPPQLGQRLIHPTTIQALTRSLLEKNDKLDVRKPEDRETMRRTTAMIRVVVEYSVQAARLAATTLNEEGALQMELRCMSWLYGMAGYENTVALGIHEAQRLDEAQAQLAQAQVQCDQAHAELRRLQLAQKLIKGER